jgi:hypothetical protein
MAIPEIKAYLKILPKISEQKVLKGKIIAKQNFMITPISLTIP